MSSRIMNNAKTALYIDGVRVAEGESIMVRTSGKRLKKNCPCVKCQKWRAEREMGRIHKAMSEAFTRMATSAVVFRTPVIESDIVKGPTSKDAPFLMVGDKDASKAKP